MRTGRYSTRVNVKCEAFGIHQFKTDWSAGTDTTVARTWIGWDNALTTVDSINSGGISPSVSGEFLWWAARFTTYKINALLIEYKAYDIRSGPGAVGTTVVQNRDSW